MTLASQDYGTATFPATFTVEDSCTLQFTDMGNGNNKFYCLELHKADSKWRLYSCYGRTGKTGVKEERLPATEEMARKEYESIIRSKEKKGYKRVQVAATSKGTDIGNGRILSSDVHVQESVVSGRTCAKISQSVQALVSRLYSEAGQGCQSQLSGRLETTAKNPLGTLTTGQINEGKDIIQRMHALLTSRPELVNTTESDILALTNSYYAAIPQEIPLRPRDEDGRKEWLKRWCLNRADILDKQRDFLDLLGDVKGMISGFDSDDVYTKYEQIECQFEVAPTSEFDKIKHFLESTSSDSHNWRLHAKNIWRVGSKAQIPYRQTMEGIGNIKPLFHGSRPSNILGICKKGLLLRPPGAYVTGSMFGNGLYFADVSTKSSQYATARFGGGSGNSDSYFMFVADVALGRIKEYAYSQGHLQSAPATYHSVKGIKGRSLAHNEYIVYDVRQNQLNYLVEFTQSY